MNQQDMIPSYCTVSQSQSFKANTAESHEPSPDHSNDDETHKRIPFGCEIMQVLESRQYDDAMWWGNTGRSFIINPPKFQKTVMKHHFHGNQFESLTRKFNRYGFRRVKSSERDYSKAVTSAAAGADDLIEFHHPSFIRGRHDLLKHIRIVRRVKLQVRISPFGTVAAEYNPVRPSDDIGNKALSKSFSHCSRTPTAILQERSPSSVAAPAMSVTAMLRDRFNTRLEALEKSLLVGNSFRNLEYQQQSLTLRRGDLLSGMARLAHLRKQVDEQSTMVGTTCNRSALLDRWLLQSMLSKSHDPIHLVSALLPSSTLLVSSPSSRRFGWSEDAFPHPPNTHRSDSNIVFHALDRAANVITFPTTKTNRATIPVIRRS